MTALAAIDGASSEPIDWSDNYNEPDIVAKLKVPTDNIMRLEGFRKRFVDILTPFLRELGASPIGAGRVSIAVGESLINGARWGNRYREKSYLILRISRHFTPGYQRFSISVQDQGQGFNPKNLPHAAPMTGESFDFMDIRFELGLEDGGFGLRMLRNSSHYHWNNPIRKATLTWNIENLNILE
jgi:anti-sigma regulatory factor (Ser/Thr protein kinase)